MDWNYIQPVEIIFGCGRIQELEKLLKIYQRPLLVSDPVFRSNGLAKRIQEAAGIRDIYFGISPNPDICEVDSCSQLIRKQGIDCIIALGGGSSLDLAKAASIAAEQIEEYFNGSMQVPKEHLPVIAVPTTAGTGSEVTCVSVLTDRRTGKKAPLVSDSFYPKTALIDPELTISLPPDVTASAGIDVLCHAVEGYWSRGHQPVCDALAVSAAKTVFSWLPTAYREPENITAREKMAEASLIAGMAFTLPKTTAPHACSFPLTSRLGIPHGIACGLTLDYFARVNRIDPRTRELAGLLGYPNADAFADAVAELKKNLHLRTDLRDMELSEKEIHELAALSRHPNMENNPVEITEEILLDLYQTLAVTAQKPADGGK